MTTIEGEIKSVPFSGQNGFDIVTVNSQGIIYSVKGCFNHPNKGQTVRITGEESVHPIYGPQIMATDISFPTPTSKEGIIAYLSSGKFKGIGKKLAERIVNQFGTDTLNILDTKPTEFLQIKGISQTMLSNLMDGHKQSQGMFEIYNFSKGVLTLSECNKIFEHYKDKAVEQLKQNPYELIYHINGFGFKKVDKIARKLGLDFMSQERADAGVTFVVKEYTEKNGHSYIKDIDLQAEAESTLYPLEFEYDPNNKKQREVTKELEHWNKSGVADKLTKKLELTKSDIQRIEDYINQTDKRSELICNAIVNEIDKGFLILEDDNIFHKDLYQAEKKCASIICSLLGEKPVRTYSEIQIQKKINEYENNNSFELNEEQKDAVVKALTSRISVITGGPGRGKTTIIDAILSIWGKHDYILCAPTGRAAQRMKESTGREACTIHSLVMFPRSPIYDNIVFVDEASMLDILLAEKTLQFFKDCQIVFIGDVKQLPSIGPGCFLKDLVESKYVPTVFLKKCHRNQGSINLNSLLIDEGKTLSQLIKDNDFTFDSVRREAILAKIIYYYKKARQTYDEKDVCVLCAQRERGGASVKAVNDIIRKLYNPESKHEVIAGCQFRVGDRIMQTKNHTNKQVKKDGKYSFGIYNGDCGSIQSFDPNDKTFIVEFDDGRTASFTIEETEEFILAWAITIHKSQGSEYPCIIVPHSFEHFSMLERNIIYTAITRGSKECHLLGEAAAIDKAIANISSKLRLSKLKERIEENM